MAGSCELLNAILVATKREISRVPEEALPSQRVSGTSYVTSPNNSMDNY
jgi:hypothetical protein